jgi:hypothetical protein
MLIQSLRHPTPSLLIIISFTIKSPARLRMLVKGARTPERESVPLPQNIALFALLE